MTRKEILDWLQSHQSSVQGDPSAAVEEAERQVRRHAAEQAWLHARGIAERQVERWKDRATGIHASEDFVARELCKDLARELKHLEPHPEAGHEEALVGEEALSPFDREARDALRGWVRDVAGEEEHRVWKEVVRFTRARARSLVSEGAASSEHSWELTHSYAETAARLAGVLAHDYEERARGT